MRWILLIVFLVTAPMARAQSTTIGIDWREPPTQVALGASFELRLERRYPAAATIAGFDPTSLAPLEAEVLATSRERRGEGIVETIRLRCRAFLLDELRLEPLELIGDLDGKALRATSGPLVLKIEGLLDENDPGSIETPGGPLAWRQRSSLGYFVLAGMLLASSAFVVCLRRLRPAAEEAAVPSLREKLAAIAAAPASPIWAGQVSRHLRDELASRCRPDEPERSSTDWRGSGRLVDLVGPRSAARLGDLLVRLDEIVYADLELDLDGEARADLEGEVAYALSCLETPAVGEESA